MKSSPLERNGIPLYRQVSGLLLRRLEAGEWTVGDQIPTIDDFMTQYGVSRVTMRQALAHLENDGLVQRGRGRGTFVTGDATADRWLILPTEWSDLITHIDRLNARVSVIRSEQVDNPPIHASGKLAQSYWHTRRINFTERAPYSLTDIHLSWSVYSKDPSAYEQRPILPILAQHERRRLARASQTLEIRTADLDTSRHLQIEVGAPVAEVLRCAWDHQDTLLYHANIRYPARHLRIDTELLTRAPERSPSTRKSASTRKERKS